jgi:MEDS: MEthanogen/methylotroph, DcmR Sensory domain
MHHSHRAHAELDWLRAGDHVCQFYDTSEELTEALIPYFKAGLERQEACGWVAGGPEEVERANGAMRMAVADFDRRVAAGQMQVMSREEWVRKCGTLSTAERIQGWLSFKDEALASGYTGIRSAGDLSSLYESSLDEFLTYERAADRAFKDQPIVALCAYCLTRYSGKTVLEAMQAHSFGLTKRRGRWSPIEMWHRNQLSTRVAHAPSVRSPNEEADLVEVLEELLAVYMLAFPGRVKLEGRQVSLPAFAATKLRLAVHELAANALTVGALAIAEGTLIIRWHVSANGSRRLRVDWTEHGLSGLRLPETIGRGTYVIASTVENYVRIFGSTGMRCTFEMPL